MRRRGSGLERFAGVHEVFARRAVRSMTGFGIGEAPLGQGRTVVEIRSLNHRFLEVRVRMPGELSDQCFFVEQLARERLTRGRFDIGVRLEGAALPPPRFAVERARAAYLAMNALKEELAPGTELPLSAITALPDLVTSSTSADTEAVQRSLKQAIDAAIAHLDVMRRQEGEALRRELTHRLKAARSFRDRFAERGGEVVALYRSRLAERLERLLQDRGVELEPGRLETELAILADKSDVTEELVRLESHFDQFERLLASDEPVGRRLDFLLQEIGREANTVGSKSQDAPLAHLVVEMKAEVERLREQVQNVE